MCRSSFRPLWWLTLLLALGWNAGAWAATADYPKTIEALQQRYVDEVQAHSKYGAYAKKAVEEDYPNIAYLFRALAASEAVHARNFATLLKELGADVPSVPSSVEVTTTRKHLKQATDVEADEIDREYPEILKRIEPEGYSKAIENITYAWEAEKQHRELILKIRNASVRFFGLLVKHIEGDPTRYYVCDICGSTTNELPATQCPICRHPAQHYEEVPGYPGKAENGKERDSFH